MENMICNRKEDIDKLFPYINKPVYVSGFCWNKKFDGWVVLYDSNKDSWQDMNVMFDYKGHVYSAYGFLPSAYTMCTSSTYNNAIYKDKV